MVLCFILGRNVLGHNFIIKTLISFIIIKNLELKLDAESEKMVKTNTLIMYLIVKISLSSVLY